MPHGGAKGPRGRHRRRRAHGDRAAVVRRRRGIRRTEAPRSAAGPVGRLCVLRSRRDPHPRRRLHRLGALLRHVGRVRDRFVPRRSAATGRWRTGRGGRSTTAFRRSGAAAPRRRSALGRLRLIRARPRRILSCPNALRYGSRGSDKSRAPARTQGSLRGSFRVRPEDIASLPLHTGRRVNCQRREHAMQPYETFRVGHVERDAVVERLAAAYAEGRIDAPSSTRERRRPGRPYPCRAAPLLVDMPGSFGYRPDALPAPAPAPPASVHVGRPRVGDAGSLLRLVLLVLRSAPLPDRRGPQPELRPSARRRGAELPALRPAHG